MQILGGGSVIIRDLHILQRAQGSCRKQGPDAWLRLYTSGHCDRGREPTEKRLTTFRSWLSAHPLPSVT
jgi:hypothetical protein